MKKIFWSIFGLSVLSIPSVVTLSSCATKKIEQPTVYNEIDVLTNSDFVNIKTFTADDWVIFISNNNTNKINELKAAIERSIKTNGDPNFLFNENASIISVNTKNGDKQGYKNLELTINNVNNKLLVLIKNLPVFSSSYFKPPVKYSYTFEQINLSLLENIPYQDINDAQWTKAFNEYVGENTYVVPDNIYLVTNKSLSTINQNEFIIKYNIDPNYMQQVESLPNASQFKEITITVKLSPYIGKELQEKFSLDSVQTTRIFGANATIETVNQLSDIEIYNKLKTYVDSLGNIQPIRDCIDVNNPNNVVGFSKNNNIINNPTFNTMTIKFESNENNVKKYRYIFDLKFKVITNEKNS